MKSRPFYMRESPCLSVQILFLRHLLSPLRQYPISVCGYWLATFPQHPRDGEIFPSGRPPRRLHCRSFLQLLTPFHETHSICQNLDRLRRVGPAHSCRMGPIRCRRWQLERSAGHQHLTPARHWHRKKQIALRGAKPQQRDLQSGQHLEHFRVHE